MAMTIRKWGSCLAVRIPKSVAQRLNLKEGMEVKFDTARSVAALRPQQHRRHTLASLLAKTKGPNPHGEQ
jgi:antitoxin MazE